MASRNFVSVPLFLVRYGSPGVAAAPALPLGAGGPMLLGSRVGGASSDGLAATRAAAASSAAAAAQK